jgi:hypothetical protein
MKKCLTSSPIREMQIKTSLGFHVTPVRMAIIKNKTTNAGEDVREKEPSYTADGNIS